MAQFQHVVELEAQRRYRAGRCGVFVSATQSAAATATDASQPAIPQASAGAAPTSRREMLAQHG